MVDRTKKLSTREIDESKHGEAVRCRALRLVLLVAVCLACELLCGKVFAQDGPPTPAEVAAPAVTPESLRVQLQAVQSDTELDEATRSRVAAVYQSAIADLESTQLLKDQLAKFQADIEAVPSRMEKTQQEVERLKSAPVEVELPDVEDWSVDQVESRAREVRDTLDKLRSTLADLQAETSRRASRRQEIVARITELQGELETGVPASNGDDGEPAVFRDAQKVLAQVQRVAKNLQLDALRKELDFYDRAAPLLQLQQDLTAQQIKRSETEVSVWEGLAKQRREQQFAAQQSAAAEQKNAAAPELAELADENLRFVELRKSLLADTEKASARNNELTQTVNELRRDYRQLSDAIGPEIVVSAAIGEQLRRQREELDEISDIRRAHRHRLQAVYDRGIEQFEVQRTLQDLSDMDAAVAAAKRELETQYPAPRVAELDTEIRQILENRKEVLGGVKSDYEKYFDVMSKLGTQQEALMRLVADYGAFIDARVLWIRSLPSVRWADLVGLRDAARWLTDATAWRQLITDFVRTLREIIITNVLVLVGVGVLAVMRPKLKERLELVGRQAESSACRDFVPTLYAIGYTLVLAVFWPLVLGWIAWQLIQPDATSPLAQPLGSGLQLAAILLFPIAVWRWSSRPRGLGAAHFGWQPKALRSIESNAVVLAVSMVPAAMLSRTFQESRNIVLQHSGARFAMVVGSIAMAVVFYRVLSPKSGALADYLKNHPESWFYRLRFLCFFSAVGVPIAFALMALAGYQYTAVQLMRRFFMSIALVSAAWLVGATCLRWIRLKHRSLAIDQARERLAAAAVESKEEPARREVPVVRTSDAVNLAEVSAQTLRLLWSFTTAVTIVGLYVIWLGVLPAMERLDQYHLWRTTEAAQQFTPVVIPGEEAASSTATPTVAQKWVWVTLGDLVGSIILLILTAIAVRNIPGLLEIALLQRLPLDAALRFAITSVTRYVLIITGVAWALTMIGFGWNKIQWLAAGISVGLGFGLQEVFANFVSGLVVLFERPLRKGDIVTVGDVTGVVIDIRTRATTIQDWDRKELIVPNKELITNRLLNWTLNDKISRLVIQVGVAYGSNIALVRETLLEIAQLHSHVLDDPEPTVTFDLFGASTLNFTLRVYLQGLEERLAVTHDLHHAIHDRFHALGIEIAFPQQDVHIKSMPEARG
jgi:potassium efflux system protein